MISLKRPKTDLPWLEEVGLEKSKPYYHTKLGAAFLGDSLAGMRKIPSESVDLVFTSPPFALTRKKEYGNEPIERYLEWFLPFCEEIKRILTPEGSFVLDIGGPWIPGACSVDRLGLAPCVLNGSVTQSISRYDMALEPDQETT